MYFVVKTHALENELFFYVGLFPCKPIIWSFTNPTLYKPEDVELLECLDYCDCIEKSIINKVNF